MFQFKLQYYDQYKKAWSTGFTMEILPCAHCYTWRYGHNSYPHSIKRHLKHFSRRQHDYFSFCCGKACHPSTYISTTNFKISSTWISVLMVALTLLMGSNKRLRFNVCVCVELCSRLTLQFNFHPSDEMNRARSRSYLKPLTCGLQTELTGRRGSQFVD